MITGEAKYADLIERTLYNGFLAGLSLDGQRYVYANPPQVREAMWPAAMTATTGGSPGSGARAARRTSCAPSHRWSTMCFSAAPRGRFCTVHVRTACRRIG